MDPYNTADSFGAPAAARPPVAPQSANPYEAPRAAVRDHADDDTIELASRLGRLGAALIDSAIFAVPAIVLAVALPGFAKYAEGGGSGGNAGLAAAMTAFGALVIVLAIAQFVLLYRSGQTIGKKIVGIKIVRPDGSRVSFPRMLFMRYGIPGVIGWIPVVGLIFALVDVLFIFAEDRRTLHDKIADTVVVNA